MKDFITGLTMDELWQLNRIACTGWTARKFRNECRREMLRRDPNCFTVCLIVEEMSDGHGLILARLDAAAE